MANLELTGYLDSNKSLRSVNTGDTLANAAAVKTALGIPATSVSSVGLSVPTGLTVAGSPIISAGTLAVSFTAGYSIPTTANQSNWSTAFGWGNHALAGYLTSESDPVFTASAAFGISAGNITNWNSAHAAINRWGGGASGLNASIGRTSLGAGAVGSSLFQLAGAGAIRFIRVNADNSVTMLDAADFKTALSISGGGDVSGPASSVDGHIALFAGTTGKLLKTSGAAMSSKQDTLVSGTNIKTVGGVSILGSGDIVISGTGTVTSVDMSVPTGLTISGNPITGAGTLALGLDTGYSIPTTSNQAIWTGKQNALVSGTSIKTINSTSLLGAGNIAIPGMTYPAAGIAVSTGAGWNTSKAAPAGDLVGTTATQTLTNKTVTAPVLSGGYTEPPFTVTGTTPAISPANGSIQTWTLSANSTPSAGTWADGQSITLMIDDGTARTINWASMSITWKTGGGTAPTLLTTGLTPIVLTKLGSTLFGFRAGDA